ncbi:MAG: DUF368 domain-containing protein [Candidatus Eisenbacteria bacterium]|uniref:DUF368 domain-containing protein n=1 Tax=Eiseniibacteriota bacterium TaxID=2212470 RepID=A0A7Y2EGU3_UNCEI|nr:DUF368 domain-containing protein [Candidatus Eisenbacteria bacterium]
MRQHVSVFLKGAAMGAANVIPGVSGGTIAFITGIYERLINALKSFDLEAVGHLFKGRFGAFAKHIDFGFLVALMVGVLVSVLSLAKLLEYLFIEHPVFLWAFFFGLILASVVFVAKTVDKWNAATIGMLILGIAIAAGIAFLKPAAENTHPIYMFACGIVAICSMIIPGLSGSFVLILMGNYMLVLGAISELDIKLLIPFGIGCVFGLLAFSHLLSYIFKRFKNGAVALLSGFIFGSLLIIWPWKNEVYLLDASGVPIIRKGEQVIQGYDWYLPSSLNQEVLIAIGLMVVGFVMVAAMERFAADNPKATS